MSNNIKETNVIVGDNILKVLLQSLKIQLENLNNINEEIYISKLKESGGFSTKKGEK